MNMVNEPVQYLQEHLQDLQDNNYGELHMTKVRCFRN